VLRVEKKAQKFIKEHRYEFREIYKRHPLETGSWTLAYEIHSFDYRTKDRTLRFHIFNGRAVLDRYVTMKIVGI